MVFGSVDIFASPAASALRCVPINTAPALWTDGARHFIVFQEPSAGPDWLSEPVSGVGLSFDQWISLESRYGPTKLSAGELKDLVANWSEISHGRDDINYST